MATKTKEIIDLTDEREVIILESGDEAENPRSNLKKRARQTTGSTSTDDVSTRADVFNPNGHKKTRRVGRKKKRKLAIVGAEEGEIVELDVEDESQQVSREESREATEAEEASKDAPKKSNKGLAKDSGIRSLLDRLADADEITPIASSSDSKPSSSKPKRKKNKKRKVDDATSTKPTTGQDVLPNANGAEDSLEPLLFFVDDTPADVPPSAQPSAPPPVVGSSKPVQEPDKPALLLPTHVSVFEGDTSGPIQIIAPPALDSDDEDYIEYLDYDDDRRAGVARYFDDPADIADTKASKATRMICKKCGAEGQHKTHDCPVVICLTCGARDEHSTRSCPISKTCYTCGMKGHINRDCPHRYTARGMKGDYDDCDRCGSTIHNTNECPTLWRMYEYVTDAERLRILSEREQKRDLEIGEGGEGYIAPEDWCYNCGACGHLGFDCDQDHRYDHPREPPAFSSINISTGPFTDATDTGQRKPGKAAAYASRMEEAWNDGGVLPLDVGRQAKKKEKVRMERRAQEMQEDDGEDWFANRRPRQPKGQNGGGTPKGPRNDRQNTKITFGRVDDSRFGGRDRKYGGRRDGYHDDLPGPSRETDSIQIRGASRRHENPRREDNDDWDGSIRGAASRRANDYESRSRDALYDSRRKERSRYDDRYDRDRRRDGRGSSPRREPRYRGGYSR